MRLPHWKLLLVFLVLHYHDNAAEPSPKQAAAAARRKEERRKKHAQHHAKVQWSSGLEGTDYDYCPVSRQLPAPKNETIILCLLQLGLQTVDEFALLLRTIRVFAPRNHLYVSSDTAVSEWLRAPQQRLLLPPPDELHVFVALNAYSKSAGRSRLEHAGLWAAFNAEKAVLLARALQEHEHRKEASPGRTAALFMDSDVFLTAPLPMMPAGDLVLAPHYASSEQERKNGRFNSGTALVRSVEVATDWAFLTTTYGVQRSLRCPDQISLEPLVARHGAACFPRGWDVGSYQLRSDRSRGAVSLWKNISCFRRQAAGSVVDDVVVDNDIDDDADHEVLVGSGSSTVYSFHLHLHAISGEEQLRIATGAVNAKLRECGLGAFFDGGGGGVTSTSTIPMGRIVLRGVPDAYGEALKSSNVTPSPPLPSRDHLEQQQQQQQLVDDENNRKEYHERAAAADDDAMTPLQEQHSPFSPPLPLPPAPPAPPPSGSNSITTTTTTTTTTTIRQRLSINVLTFDRTESLRRLLLSLEAADYLGDEAYLRIHIDVPLPEDDGERGGGAAPARPSASVVAVARAFNWSHGAKAVLPKRRHAGLFGQWMQAWTPASEEDWGVILEDDLEVSRHFYRWLKEARAFERGVAVSHTKPHQQQDQDQEQEQQEQEQEQEQEQGREENPPPPPRVVRVGAVSLQRPTLVASLVNGSRGRMPPANDNRPFLYALCGSWGFAPVAAHWLDFLRWAAEVERRRVALGEHIPTLPGTVMEEWYWRQAKQGKMWTLHWSQFSAERGLYTLHANAPGGRTFAANYREHGVNNAKKTKGRDFGVVQQWDAAAFELRGSEASSSSSFSSSSSSSVLVYNYNAQPIGPFPR